MKTEIRDEIVGVSERFVDDYTEIEQNYEISIMGYPRNLVSET